MPIVQIASRCCLLGLLLLAAGTAGVLAAAGAIRLGDS
jgi:hypothetical protein